MLKRLLVLIFIFICFTVTPAFSVCSFESSDPSCIRFSNSFHNFDLVFSPEDELKSFDVEIYNIENPSNKLKLTIEDNSFRNLNPFTIPGVYVVEITSTSKAGIVSSETFEYIFDPLETLPPVLDVEKYSDSSTLRLAGLSKPSSNVLVSTSSGSSVNLNVDSNGEFLGSVELNSGWNLLDFKSISLNGRTSESVKRLVHNGILNENPSSSVSSISLDDLTVLNKNSILESGKVITSNREFIVSGSLSGSNLEGAIVYVQGNRVLADSSGRFMSFVLLNEGENEIEVISNNQETSSVVVYGDLNFKFENFDYDKVVGTNSVNFQVTSNLDLPFDTYVNGNYFSTVDISNSNADLTLNNLVSGKNYIYFEGHNAENFEEIIYVDSELPEIETLFKDNIANQNELVIKVTDDVSVDLSSIEIDFGSGIRISSSNAEIVGDYFIFDITSIPNGNYNLEISASDTLGNKRTVTSPLSINKENTLIERISIIDGSVLGNNIFLNGGEQKLVLVPSRFIAFEKIIMDGIEQIDYEIKSNGDVHINLDIVKSEGEILFKFINNEFVKFEQSYTYFSDDEKPTYELDYTTRAYSNGIDSVRITGEIKDSNFNWDSLSFNNKKNILRYGNYFEAFIGPEDIKSGNLNLVGFDFSENSFENSVVGSLLFIESEEIETFFEKFSSNSFEGSFDNTKSNINFISKYDGFDTISIPVLDSFELATPDREGIRSINLDATSSSNKRIKSKSTVSVDVSNPEIYFTEGDDDTIKIIIDGTLSPVNMETLDIKVNSENLDTLSFCSDYTRVGVYDLCVEILSTDVLDIQVSLEDEVGNRASKTFTGNFDQILEENFLMKIYFTGNDLNYIDNIGVIQGKVMSPSILENVKIGNTNCEFDDYNFVCPSHMTFGENEFTITATNVKSEEVSSTFIQNLIRDDLDVEIEGLTGNALFNVGEDFFTLADNVNVLGEVNRDSFISVLIDDREVRSGRGDNTFTIPVDLSSHQSGKVSDELDIKLKVEDDHGNIAFSDKIKLIYNRIAQTLVSVVIG